MRLYLLVVVLACTAVAAGPPAVPPEAMLRTHLLEQCQKHFDTRRTAVAGLKTVADVETRQKRLRERFVAALGGFPERTPLKAKVVGTLRGDGFRIEKIVFESRPGHHVTANLYLPDGKGPFPGVLMPIGHSLTGKAAEYIQRGAMLLARHGLAVLAYDPIGQGERRQLLEGGKAALSSSTAEHTMIGVGALLVGWNTATYRVWDGMRALDYLASRPEIDAKRLGCTGCSGGGTMTSYLMALDERIIAAAPSCYLTSLERLFATLGPQDAEQNITGQVAFGLDHADYLGLHAPRPALIAAATRDFFDIQGTWVSFREAKRLYGVLGHPERIDLIESDTTHGFPRPQREAVLRFMRRWLLNKDDALIETDLPLFKEADLRCTRTGQVLEDLKGVSAFQLTARRAKELASERAVKLAATKPDEFVASVRQLLGLPHAVPAATVRERGSEDRDGLTLRRRDFVTEPGITVPGVLLSGKESRGPLIVHARDDHAAITKLAREGRRVLVVDLRGLGATAPSRATKVGAFGGDYREAFLSLHLARPLVGQRTHDLLAVLAALDEEVELVGVGKAALAAIHAAVLDRRVKAVRLERMLVSWSDVASTPISHDQLTNVVPGVLARYDLPELAARLAPRPLTVVDGRDPVGKAVSRDALDLAYAATRTAYDARGAGKQLELRAGE